MGEPENGVPRWVEVRFTANENRIDALEDDVRLLRVDLTNTRVTVGNLFGRMLIISALIGALVSSAFALLFRLIGGGHGGP